MTGKSNRITVTNDKGYLAKEEIERRMTPINTSVRIALHS
jgi:phosphatidate phosphatase APP1